MVKICGIRRVQDALMAAEAGADAIGFIFWPNIPRFIDPFRARAIAAALPSLVMTVGVFVDQPADYIGGVASLVGLTAVQLHGSETPAFAASLRRPVVKAISRSGAAPFAVSAWPSNITVLVDAHDPAKRGGTGVTVDWEAAAEIARKRRVILAGGLTPDNVGDAIARVRPYGIDVSSGVEVSPGVKSPERIKALFAAIQASDAKHNLTA